MPSGIGKDIKKKKSRQRMPQTPQGPQDPREPDSAGPSKMDAGASTSGGGGGGGGGGDPPYVPPFERAHGLSQEQMDHASQLFEAFKDNFNFEVNTNVVYLTYADLKSQPADLIQNKNAWTTRILDLHDEQGSYEIRLRATGPFVEQVHLMLKWAGLTPRSWNLLINTVVFDNSEENLSKLNMMAHVCRYKK